MALGEPISSVCWGALVNPVLFIEYESVNEASGIQKEIVGEGAPSRDPVGALIHQRAHEFEGRLILSKTLQQWDVAGNVIAEKNVSQNEGVQFGYTAGVSRSLSTSRRGTSSRQLSRGNSEKGSVVRASIGFGVTSASERSVPHRLFQGRVVIDGDVCDPYTTF